MNVVIFGASRGVGRCLTEQALAQGHHVTADHRRALEEIRKHAPEWIVVRSLLLNDGPLTGHYRRAVDDLPAKGMQIARADVADFMLRQATSDNYLYKVPAIAY